MSSAGLGVIILAAGASTRLGQPKQLVRHHGQSLIRRAAQQVRGLQPAICIVVTGAESVAVSAELADLPVQCEYNPLWKAGMAASIASGVRAMPGNIDGAMLYLCDQWRLEEQDLARLHARWLEDTSKIVASTWDGTTGPPVIFPIRYVENLRELRGDLGARAVIEIHRAETILVENANAAFDLDTPRDLEILRQSRLQPVT